MDILKGHPLSLTMTMAVFLFNQIKKKMEVCFFRDLSSVGLFDEAKPFSSLPHLLCRAADAFNIHCVRKCNVHYI